MAMRLWQENHQCAEADWEQSIKDALEIHRVYLKTGIKLSKPELDFRRASHRRAKEVSLSQPIKKEKEIFWRNKGKWERLIT